MYCTYGNYCVHAVRYSTGTVKVLLYHTVFYEQECSNRKTVPARLVTWIPNTAHGQSPLVYKFVAYII